MASGPNYVAAARPGRRGPAIATPPLDTSAGATANKRYSYSDTPVEMQPPKFTHPIASPTNSTIDESPITPASLNSRVLPIYTEPETAHALEREEKAHLLAQQQRQQQRLQHQPPPPAGVHPAYYAPYNDQNERQAHYPQNQQQQGSALGRGGNNTSPQFSITAPTPLSPNSPPIPPPPHNQNHLHHHQHPNGTANRDTLKPHAAKSPDPRKTPSPAPPTDPSSTTNPTPTTSIIPDSFAPPPTIPTPDINPSTHLPGQSISPNSTTTPHWQHSLFTPSATCCLALFLPCLVYGKTQYRLNRKLAREDPTNLLGYESCNGACGIFSLACGLQGVLAAIQRSRVRKVYGIEGDFLTDLVNGCCCCCCVVAQDEREMMEREEARRFTGGKDGPGRAATGAYVSAGGGMAYAPPPR